MGKKRIKIKYGRYGEEKPNFFEKLKNLLRKDKKCTKMLLRD